MTACPICSTEATAKREVYWTCPGCGLYFQDPLPPKLLHGEHEVWLGQKMGEDEIGANKALADWLFDMAMHKTPGPTLDIGASYPILAHCFAEYGCDAHAIDPDDEILKPHGLNVTCQKLDFEACTFVDDDWKLITFCHSFEHLYRPLDAFRKLRRIIAYDGRLFIRMPDSMVKGIERDYTPGHYTIHPFVYSISALAQICAATDTFVIEHSREVLPGQRDSILAPI